MTDSAEIARLKAEAAQAAAEAAAAKAAAAQAALDAAIASTPASAVEQAGGQVLAPTEVVDSIFEQDRLAGVVTSEGREHRADRVVLATGAWSGAGSWLPPSARPPDRPARGWPR